MRNGFVKRADARAGRNDPRKNVCREIESFKQVVGPGTLCGMEKLSRGRIRKFGNLCGTETPMEKVGHHQQAIRRLQNLRIIFLPGEQLIQSIDLHELQASGGKNLCTRSATECISHNAVASGVAIMKWLGHELIGFGKENVVHAPGIDADGFDRLAVCSSGQAEAVLDFGPETENVPTQGARNFDRTIREAMQLFYNNTFAVPEACHDAAAFRAEIDAEIALGFHVGFGKLDRFFTACRAARKNLVTVGYYELP